MRTPTQPPSLHNPFARTRTHLRRNTRWFSTHTPSSASTSTLHRPGPNHRVEIAYTPHIAASAAVLTDGEEKGRKTKRRKNSDASAYSTDEVAARCDARVRDVSEVPDLYYSPGSGSGSEEESWFHSGDDNDEEEEGDERVPPKQKVVRRSQGAHGERRVRDTYAPATPFVLPETARLSPIAGNLRGGRDGPIELGWAQFRDGEVEEDTGRKESNVTVFPRMSYIIPTLPPKDTKKSKSERKAEKAENGRTASSSAQPHTVLAPSKSKTDLKDIYRSARQIYAAGPKGEGQKVWKGVQEVREQKRLRKVKHERERAIAIEEAKRQVLEQQALEMHATAQEFDAKLRANRGPSRLPSARPAPSRPRPAEPLGVRRRVSLPETSASLMMPTSNKAECKGDGGAKKRKDSESSDYTSLSIPITASASVQYDATEVILDRSSQPPPVPQLNRGPRSGSEASGVGKRRVERVTPKKIGLPSPPVPPKVRPYHFPTDLVGQPAQRPHQQPRHGKQEKKPERDWFANALGSFFSVHIEPPSEAHADRGPVRKQEIFNAERAMARKHEKLKASISQPYPASCPGGVTANFAKECGGVGGPAAAISLPPGVNRKSKLVKHNEKKGKSEDKAERYSPLAPPSQSRPPPPPLPPKPHMPESRSSSTETKETRGWLDLFTKHEVSGKYFTHGFRKSDQSLGGTRKRADSDTSFACEGIDGIDQPAQPRGAVNPRVQLSRVRSKLRDPGLSRQPAPRKYVPDENVVFIPEPLFTDCRKGKLRTVRELPVLDIRNTRFYAPYDDVLSEYGC